jgi:hypothetical protein
MVRALALAVLLFVAAPAPSLAAETKDAAAGESARAMDVLNLVVPVVREGRLVNYVFINARIQIANGVDIFKTRDQGHFLRDALVKAVHRQSVVAADRDDAIDAEAAKALIAETARQTLGANAVRSVDILSVSSLRPGRPVRS